MRSLALRTHPLVFGVTLFLASETMFFAGLFAAYFDLRAGSAVWPPAGIHPDVAEATVGTVLLALSSAFMVAMPRAMDRRGARGARPWILAAIVVAVLFVALTLHGWEHADFGIASNAYGSLYYTMTGFHLLHVIAGIVLLTALLLGLRTPALAANHRAGAEAISYYWHFVFVVWVGLFGTIFLLQ